MNEAARTNAARAGRLLFAALGGYALASGVMALLGGGLPRLGMARSEAAMTAALTGNLVFLAVFIWVVASSRPLRTSLIVGIGAAGLILGAPLLVEN